MIKSFLLNAENQRQTSSFSKTNQRNIKEPFFCIYSNPLFFLRFNINEQITDVFYEPVTGVREKDAEKNARELKLKDLQVNYYLFSAIEKNILKTILQKNTSSQLWKSMKNKYQGNPRVQRAQLQALWREFEILKMNEGGAIADYISKSRGYREQHGK